MDFLRAGETLLRSTQPLLPFLAPSAARPRSQRAIGLVSGQCKPRRHPFTTTSFKNADERRTDPPAEHQRQSVPSDTASRLDSVLDGTKGQYHPPKGDSISEILDTLTPSRRATPVGRRPSPGNDYSEIAALFKGSDSYGPENTSNNPFLTRAPPPSPAPLLIEKVLPMKLNPSVGRTITVDSARGMDVGRAFRTLEMQCNRNSVKRDFMRQRYHERAGLKRKRLRGERWRRRFKENFKGVVGLVKKMTAQGW
ncbi:hypothetical protein LTR91_015402 [Friedmanniomyces endolithicus]|uniref:Ribosomal protein S21 n=1 Tax=Friedmanniomyces endolithicus TaxID=329885 RepID=A0AAN6K9Z4_9PEZI|nr:hypothetical protein LTS09_015938 [Friedmanniomyces endolithicus]KAK0293390.1 hypothetical protein LTS00_007636 [Friedmanniomyces endolithicus]KAK0971616.1 hypothetical protein LTS01_015246 [Friedmanniomyces endolithicus]KAK0971848.1 hypothetical protein LTR91_015402 [Friedmanniomyces endolithicus]KAK0979931.1 hypothetical protein LTR54_015443 [Friedmanniomyces endolithicus]